MKKNKKIILFTILSLLFSTNVYASCTEEEINDFKKIEDEYKITYEFNKETKDYTITINQTQSDKYGFIIEIDELNCNKLNNTQIECYNVPIASYNVEITGKTETCQDVLKKFTLDLPDYNKYFEDPLCEGLEDFVLCQPTYNKEIDYDTFVSRVNTEIKRRKKEQKIPIEEQKEENTVIEYLKSNLVQIIIIIVFVIMLIITIILMSKSIKKSRRLE